MTTAEVLDLDVAQLSRTTASLDDVDLVFCLLGLLQPTEQHHAVAGATETAAKAARVAFTEIAQRWIPLDVFADAFGRLELDDAQA